MIFTAAFAVPAAIASSLFVVPASSLVAPPQLLQSATASLVATQRHSWNTASLLDSSTSTSFSPSHSLLASLDATAPITHVADAAAAADATTSTAVVFDPVLPDAPALIGMAVIVGLCIVAATVWNDQVVPVSRTKLALSKSRGGVREYLEELKGEDQRRLEQWFFTDWLQQNNKSKPAALPFLKKAKWNSGDNPVVVTAGIMMVGILVASITERIIL